MTKGILHFDSIKHSYCLPDGLCYFVDNAGPFSVNVGLCGTGYHAGENWSLSITCIGGSYDQITF